MQQKGDTVAGRKIEIILKDDAAGARTDTKRLAQELIVNRQGQLYRRLRVTPAALAAARWRPRPR